MLNIVYVCMGGGVDTFMWAAANCVEGGYENAKTEKAKYFWCLSFMQVHPHSACMYLRTATAS
jgi:hypothetical protein